MVLQLRKQLWKDIILWGVLCTSKDCPESTTRFKQWALVASSLRISSHNFGENYLYVFEAKVIADKNWETK